MWGLRRRRVGSVVSWLFNSQKQNMMISQHFVLIEYVDQMMYLIRILADRRACTYTQHVNTINMLFMLAMLVTNKCESINLLTVHSMCSIMPFVLLTPQNRSVVTSDRWLFVQSMWFNVLKYRYLLCLNLSLTTRFDSFPTKSSFFPKVLGQKSSGFRNPRVCGLLLCDGLPRCPRIFRKLDLGSFVRRARWKSWSFVTRDAVAKINSSQRVNEV